MKVIVYNAPEGGVHIMYPSDPGQIKPILDGLPASLNAVVMDHSALPPDRTYRGAWTLNNGIVSIDPIKVDQMLGVTSAVVSTISVPISAISA